MHFLKEIELLRFFNQYIPAETFKRFSVVHLRKRRVLIHLVDTTTWKKQSSLRGNMISGKCQLSFCVRQKHSALVKAYICFFLQIMLHLKLAVRYFIKVPISEIVTHINNLFLPFVCCFFLCRLNYDCHISFEYKPFFMFHLFAFAYNIVHNGKTKEKKQRKENLQRKKIVHAFSK